MLVFGCRNLGVHRRASWISSANDVVVNLGIIVSGFLVLALVNKFAYLIAARLFLQ